MVLIPTSKYRPAAIMIVNSLNVVAPINQCQKSSPIRNQLTGENECHLNWERRQLTFSENFSELNEFE